MASPTDTARLPDPDRALDRAMAASTGGPRVRQTFSLKRGWLPEPDVLTLEADYRIVSGDGGQRILARLGPHELFLDEPVRLAPVRVPKPWGQEIWFTGMEARGESTVVTPAGHLPLSQYLALAPRRLARRQPVTLLKVLDPSPEPVLGDLYFEVHERKQEVYVVSHVDAGAWPDGRGGIRYGMNQALRRRYGDDDAFRRDYLLAVKRYEAVRRALDDGRAVPAAEEAERRSAMDAFTGMRELVEGDVVVVPPWLPHSLQHGVRVVEFQTPTYERYILSFAQKVRTQNHWDTESVIERIRLDVPEPPTFEAAAEDAECIVAFDELRVWRITLSAGAAFTLPAHASYGLCMVVRGRVALGPLDLGAEEAAFVPAAALESGAQPRRGRVVNRGRDEAVVLLSAPDL